MEQIKINKKDFIEIKYTGYANSEIFDSNIEDDLKKLNSELKPKKTIIVVGEEMVVSGLDKAFPGKEIGKIYEITLSPKESFGERKRSLIKTIPLKAFTEKNVSPKPGMVLTLDNSMARIITISGARVITDFNSPLAGKEIRYKFTIVRKVEDEKEKADSLFESFFKFIPEYEIKENIILKGPKPLEYFANHFSSRFKGLIGKELGFEEKKPEEKAENKISESNLNNTSIK